MFVFRSGVLYAGVDVGLVAVRYIRDHAALLVGVVAFVAPSLARCEMAAAGLAGVAYGSCSEANPAWLVSGIARLPPGLGYKILDIPIGIAQEKRSGNLSIPLKFIQ